MGSACGMHRQLLKMWKGRLIGCAYTNSGPYILENIIGTRYEAWIVLQFGNKEKGKSRIGRVDGENKCDVNIIALRRRADLFPLRLDAISHLLDWFF